LAAFFASASALKAEPVDGTWTNVVNQPAPDLAGPIANPNTNSPIIGEEPNDPEFNSNFADMEMVYSPFSLMTLTNPGDKIVFTGSVELSGTVNSALNAGAPRTQYRFGLFKSNGDPNDLGWLGYYMSNRHGDPGTPSGTLAVKPVGNTSTPLSVTGQAVLTSAQGDGTAASLFNDGTYSMNLTIERNSLGELLVSASLLGTNSGNTYSHILSATHTTALTAGTYEFDRLVFLSGNNLDTDRMAFTDLDVTFMPAAAGLAGDFNDDGSVDAADYVLWRQNNGSNNALPNDGGLGTPIGTAHYDLWTANFGETGPGSGSTEAVPEPGTALLVVFALALLVAVSRRPKPALAPARAKS
jgi:hypothetical protein